MKSQPRLRICGPSRIVVLAALMMYSAYCVYVAHQKMRDFNFNRSSSTSSASSSSPLTTAATAAASMLNSANATIIATGELVREVMENIEVIDYHPTRYAFMLPTSIIITTFCQLAGIGGAALFQPIFLMIFPLLGTEYLLPSILSAVSSAMLIECFGFASGLIGYHKRGLVDWQIARQFLFISIPWVITGALLQSQLIRHPHALRGTYAILMLGTSAFLIIKTRPESIKSMKKRLQPSLADEDTNLENYNIMAGHFNNSDDEQHIVNESSSFTNRCDGYGKRKKDDDGDDKIKKFQESLRAPNDYDGYGKRKKDDDEDGKIKNFQQSLQATTAPVHVKSKVSSDGYRYLYFFPESKPMTHNLFTVTGSILTGLLGVGIGEVVLPQFIRGSYRMPHPVAAGTSIAIAAVTTLLATLMQFHILCNSVAEKLEKTNHTSSVSTPEIANAFMNALPWSLLQFLIPGVLIGGQLAPFLASKRVLSDTTIDEFVATLYGIVGILFGVKAFAMWK